MNTYEEIFMEKKLTTISLTQKQKEKLDSLKIHKREPYYELLDRIFKVLSPHKMRAGKNG